MKARNVEPAQQQSEEYPRERECRSYLPELERQERRLSLQSDVEEAPNSQSFPELDPREPVRCGSELRDD
jgi:hypothetical protein